MTTRLPAPPGPTRDPAGRWTRGRAPAPASVVRAVARSVLAGVLAFVVLAVGALHALQQLATNEAVRNAQAFAQADVRRVVRPAVTQGLLDGDPAAVDRFDRAMRMRVLRDPVVRMKLWSADGRVVYSDEPRYIGARFDLRGRAAEVARDGGTQAGLVRLEAAEHRFDTTRTRVLEVYARVRAPDGSPLLFELYLRDRSVTADGGRIWRSFSPAFLVALLIQLLLQVPLSVSLARRLRQGQQERERLLTRALHASDTERRRIARDLHDGAVQTLSGVAYTLEGMAARPDLSVQRAALGGAVNGARQGLAELRTLVLDIYPSALAPAGLGRALDDLARGLRSLGVAATAEVDVDLPPQQARLVHRVAQEAVRNTARHARATSACISVRRTQTGTRLVVSDDGVGFDVDVRPSGVQHFGLVMAAELAAESDGLLTVVSRPGTGTELRLDLP